MNTEDMSDLTKIVTIIVNKLEEELGIEYPYRYEDGSVDPLQVDEFVSSLDKETQSKLDDLVSRELTNLEDYHRNSQEHVKNKKNKKSKPKTKKNEPKKKKSAKKTKKSWWIF